MSWVVVAWDRDDMRDVVSIGPIETEQEAQDAGEFTSRAHAFVLDMQPVTDWFSCNTVSLNPYTDVVETCVRVVHHDGEHRTQFGRTWTGKS